MSPDFGPEAVDDSLLPDVVAERCVHARMEQATCRACADACPVGAWVIDDERLGIDSNRCDGCGLCAPACPEGAIAERFAPDRYQVEGTGVAFAACVRAGVSRAGEGVVPCLHVLGERSLLGLYGQGVRRLLVCRGDCDACPRGGVTRVDDRLGRISALLADRGLDPIRHDEVTPERWASSLSAAKARHREPAVGRRAFFRGVLKTAADTALDLARRSESGVPDFVPPGRMVPRTNGGRLSLFAPRIDPERCSGCDACARLCPHDVIRVEADAYHIEPEGCTGCGICVDVCSEQAVAVRALDRSPQSRLPLRRYRCRACGVDFHRPGIGPHHADLCPICAVSCHHRNLYQVLR